MNTHYLMILMILMIPFLLKVFVVRSRVEEDALKTENVDNCRSAVLMLCPNLKDI